MLLVVWNPVTTALPATPPLAIALTPLPPFSLAEPGPITSEDATPWPLLDCARMPSAPLLLAACESSTVAAPRKPPFASATVPQAVLLLVPIPDTLASPASPPLALANAPLLVFPFAVAPLPAIVARATPSELVASALRPSHPLALAPCVLLIVALASQSPSATTRVP